MAISFNGRYIGGSPHFPDGTLAIKFEELPSDAAGDCCITWNYEGEEECMELWHLVHHLHNIGFDYLELDVPYFPNARNDRTENSRDVFTLKYFADFINCLKFDRVRVFDPHSSVTPALLNNVRTYQPTEQIAKVIKLIGDPAIELCYPDEGSMKRYSRLVSAPYGFCSKSRDWQTGKITGMTINMNGEGHSFDGKNVLIVDDICSRGGTFLHAAKLVKEHGAKNIYLYCSHCEDTIFQGELLDAPFITGVYTTNSIFRKRSHDKITVLDWRNP